MTAVELAPSLRAWTCCPVCGGTVLPVQGDPGANAHLECRGLCKREWWGNPKPTASVLAEHDGKLLLARRAIEPFLGRWDTPGGFIEDGEEAADAAIRELREETGLECELGSVLGVWGDTYGDAGGSTLNVFYLARVADPSPAKAASDVCDLHWFAPDELPTGDDIAFACVPKALAAWRATRA